MRQLIKAVLQLAIGVCACFTTLHAQVRKVEMKSVGGVYTVPCVVNNLPMTFIFDTGASGVSISKETAMMMVEKGAIKENDVLGKQYFRIANGDVAEGLVVRLRSFEIGGVRLMDINASISLSLNAPMLLGTDVLNRFGKVTIDYDNSLILLGEETNRYMNEVSNAFRLHKFMWKSSSDEIEAMEKSEKHRVKLADGSYADWKRVSRLNGALNMYYKVRTKGISLEKSYTFENGHFRSEMFQVLQEGLVSGNPDLTISKMSLATAYRVYKVLDSLIGVECGHDYLRYCVSVSGFDCLTNEVAIEARYGHFYNAYQMPLDLTNQEAFRKTIKFYFDDLNKSRDPANRSMQVIIRRPTFNEDGYYDLCIKTNDGITYSVWLVIRRRG